MKYVRLDNKALAEIIDKAYCRAESSARHLCPTYVHWHVRFLIAAIGSLAYVFTIKWWLVLTILIPFILETYVSIKTNYNIYKEPETYWKKEQKYSTLGSYLKSGNFLKESKAYGNYDYFIDTYKARLNERNRNYNGIFSKTFEEYCWAAT